MPAREFAAKSDLTQTLASAAWSHLRCRKDLLQQSARKVYIGDRAVQAAEQHSELSQGEALRALGTTR